MGKEKTESYYKILGTTAKISNSRIKEKYIQAVKQHPPETDPEGFEKVRRAYETLKDPTKRKQYDLFRKYGSNVEDLLENAAQAIDKGDLQKANNFMDTASNIDPDNHSVAIALMELAVIKGDLGELERHFEKLQKMAANVDEKATVYSIKSQLLIKHEYYEEALEVLDTGKETYPDYTTLFSIPYAFICMDSERPEEAWESISAAIPNPEQEKFEDIYVFMTWARIMTDTEKWSSMSKVQSRFRKFLKNITDEEDKEAAYDLLMESFQDNYENIYFREAAFYIDLVKVVADNSNTEVKELQDEAKHLAKLQKEIGRLERDETAFPLLFLNVFEWFYEDLMPSEELSMVLNSMPTELVNELKEEKEEYAAGIMKIRKKYPVLYKAYKQKWDNIYAELTEGFNREMKRELRRMR